MSHPKDFYWRELARTLAKVKEDATTAKHSCQHQPLLNIPLENVVLDELHLMLRITRQKININLVHFHAQDI